MAVNQKGNLFVSAQTSQKPASYALPFVKEEPGTVNFWSPTRSDNYEQDCRTGRAYAEELLAYLGKSQDATIFGSIVRAIAKQGQYEAVEIGFCSRLNFRLCGFIGGR